MSTFDHWTYSDRPEDESATCKGCATREDAIEEGFAEEFMEQSDDDVIYVAPCREHLPHMPHYDADQLVEYCMTAHDGEFPDDWNTPLYKGCQLKPELAKELEDEIEPHLEAIEKVFLRWLAKHCGQLHFRGNEEAIVRADWDAQKKEAKP